MHPLFEKATENNQLEFNHYTEIKPVQKKKIGCDQYERMQERDSILSVISFKLLILFWTLR